MPILTVQQHLLPNYRRTSGDLMKRIVDPGFEFVEVDRTFRGQRDIRFQLILTSEKST